MPDSATLPTQIPQGQPGSFPAKAAGNSYYDFAQAVLTQLGAPLCANNLISFVSWEQAEGSGGVNNPLNTKQPGFGGTPTFGGASMAYPGWDAGIQATIKTLKNGNYPGILSAFHRCADPGTTAAAIEASPWAESHYHGNLSAIVRSVLGNGAFWTQIAGKAVPGAAPGASFGPGAASGQAVPLGPGEGGGGGKCFWKVGPFCVFDNKAAGVGMMLVGGTVVLVGTIVVLFRFKGTRELAEAAAIVPGVGAAARVVSGRAPAGRRSRRAAPSQSAAPARRAAPSSVTTQERDSVRRSELAARERSAQARTEGADARISRTRARRSTEQQREGRVVEMDDLPG